MQGVLVCAVAAVLGFVICNVCVQCSRHGAGRILRVRFGTFRRGMGLYMLHTIVQRDKIPEIF